MRTAVGHPLDVGAEALVFDVGAGELGHVGVAAHLKLMPALTALSCALRPREDESASRWRCLLL